MDEKQMNQLRDSGKKMHFERKSSFLCEGDWQLWHNKAKLLIYLQSLSSTLEISQFLQWKNGTMKCALHIQEGFLLL